jgi:hypothetical protein
MADSARWCDECMAYGDHHTDRHPQQWPEVACPYCGAHPLEACINLRASGQVEYGSGMSVSAYPYHARTKRIHPERRYAMKESD